MKNICKRGIFTLLVALIVISILPYPTANAVETNGVQAAMNQILNEYPSGSFFTLDGKACTHGKNAVKCPVCGYHGNHSCANCSLISISKAKGVSIPSGQGCAHTCLGFASYVMNRVFGLKLSGNTTQIGSGKNPANAAASYLGAKVGDLVYFYDANKSYRHIAIFMGATDTGVTLYECNVTKKPSEVSYHTIPYSQMKTYRPNHVYCAVYRANNYDKVNTTQSAPAQTPSQTPKTHTVVLNNEGSVKTITVTNGGTYSNLPELSKDGYTFEGWHTQQTGGTKITSSTKVVVTVDEILYARWTKNPDRPVTYTVILDNGSTCKQITVTNGGTYSGLTKPTKEGYTFDGWYTSETGGTRITSSTKVNLTGNQTLYAHWTKNPTKPEAIPEVTPGTICTVLLDTGFSLKVTYVTNGGNYDNLYTPTRDGYTFDGWYTEETGGTRITSSTKVNLTTTEQRIYAHWNPITSVEEKPATPSGGHWGPWSEWSTTHYFADDTRQVEDREVTEQVIISEGYTEYRYGGYVSSDGQHECWCETYLRSKFGSANLRYSDWSTTQYPATGKGWTCGQCNGNHINVGHYSADGRAWWGQYTLPSGDYFWEESRTVGPEYATDMHREWRYREWIPD